MEIKTPRSLILLCSASRRGLKRRPGKRKLFIGRRLKGVDNRRRWDGVAAVNIPPAAHYRVPPTECKLLRLLPHRRNSAARFPYFEAEDLSDKPNQRARKYRRNVLVLSLKVIRS